MFLKSKFLGVALATCVAVGVSACGGGMPKCDSKDTTNLLTQIIKEQLQKIGIPKANIDKLKISYDGFMTNSTDKDAKKVTCKAQANMNFDGDKRSDFVEYSVQATSDNQIYVEIYSGL